jgi:hypothetical protein
MESVLYFAKSGDKIKIGCSAYLEKRLQELGFVNKNCRSAGQRAVELLGTIPGGIAEEALVHAMFEDKRTRHPQTNTLTEWFEDCPKIRQFIADHCDSEAP